MNSSLPKHIDTTNLFELKSLSKKNLNKVLFESIKNGNLRKFRLAFSLLGDIRSRQFWNFRDRLIASCRAYGRWKMLEIIDPTPVYVPIVENPILSSNVTHEPVRYVEFSQADRLEMAVVPREFLIFQLNF